MGGLSEDGELSPRSRWRRCVLTPVYEAVSSFSHLHTHIHTRTHVTEPVAVFYLDITTQTRYYRPLPRFHIATLKHTRNDRPWEQFRNYINSVKTTTVNSEIHDKYLTHSNYVVKCHNMKRITVNIFP